MTYDKPQRNNLPSRYRSNRRKIRLIEVNAKCRHFKKIDLERDFAVDVYRSKAQNTIPPHTLTKIGGKYQHH
jgi:hypothetical protein